MNILLVDDDVYVIEVLQKSIDWKYLDIENVYTANSVNTAKKIIEDVPIHVLICDIEMPKENGFELLKWIREKGYIMKEILLTSYAEFEYANTAIKLNCFAYSLKPVDFEELENTIKRALQAEKETLVAENYKRYYEYWSKSVKIRKEEFWNELLLKDVLVNMQEIMSLVNNSQMAYAEHERFSLLFIKYFIYEEKKNDYYQGMIEWNMRNMVWEIFKATKLDLETVLPLKNGQYLVVINMNEEQNQEVLIDLAQKYIVRSNKKLGFDCSITIGKIENLRQTAASALQFLEICNNQSIYENRVFTLDSYEYSPKIYQPPEFKIWEKLILNNEEDKLYHLINRYIDNLEQTKTIDEGVIKRFQLDYMDMLTSALKQKNLNIYKLNIPFNTIEHINESLSSVNGTKKIVVELLRDVLRLSSVEEENNSIVWTVKEYIDHNLDKYLNREALAKMIFLNQDYLARMFKKEIGVSIGTYIVNKRIEAAKKYLENTTEAVNTIAGWVGYDNFSYFTKTFRTIVGVTPKEYRNLNSAQ